jgi:hypothetical protein
VLPLSSLTFVEMSVAESTVAPPVIGTRAEYDCDTAKAPIDNANSICFMMCLFECVKKT